MRADEVETAVHRIVAFVSHYPGHAVLRQLLGMRPDFEVVLVATDDPARGVCNAPSRIWRYGGSDEPERLVPRLAATAGLSAFTGPVRRAGGHFHRLFSEARPDALVAMVFGQRIPAHLLESVGGRAWNVHPVIPGRRLGATRGPQPIETAYRLGARELQLCLHRMTGAFDDGEELARSEPLELPPVAAPGAELMLELQRRLAPLAAELVGRVLPARFEHPHMKGRHSLPTPPGVSLTMNEQITANLTRIDELWGLHEHREPDAAVEGRCLAFVLDRRFLKDEDIEGLQFRLGVSFGHNPFTPEMATGFLPPPVLPGRLVFGIHVVGVKDRQLTLYDQWYSARPAGECEDPDQALAIARSILDGMSDEEYHGHVRESRDDKRPLHRSDLHPFEELEVVQGEAF